MNPTKHAPPCSPLDPPAAAAAVRVCADGGANRLYDELPGLVAAAATAGPSGAEEVRATYLPSAIRGDLDSIREDVLQFYRQRGVQVSDLSGTRILCACRARCPSLLSPLKLDATISSALIDYASRPTRASP